MSLRDFMQQLQEEDSSVIYSKPPEEQTQVIPPVIISNPVNVEPIRVIPTEIVENATPKVIKFKLKEPEKVEKKVPTVIIPPKKQLNTQTEVIRKIEEEIITVNEPTNAKEDVKITQVKKEENSKQKINTNINIKQMFIESGTDVSKKDKWLEYYNKAVNSKKDNIVTNKLRKGRFRVKLDTEEPGIIPSMPDVEILSDYNTYNKSANQILDDKWL